jgi:hypothetical protein
LAEHAGRDPVQPLQDLVEVVMPRYHFPQYERRPSFGENLGRSGNRAELAISIHVAIVAPDRAGDNYEFRSDNFDLSTIRRQI